jgi:hypothetical protein
MAGIDQKSVYRVKNKGMKKIKIKNLDLRG